MDSIPAREVNKRCASTFRKQMTVHARVIASQSGGLGFNPRGRKAKISSVDLFISHTPAAAVFSDGPMSAIMKILLTSIPY
jgi:hypothetical protein